MFVKHLRYLFEIGTKHRVVHFRPINICNKRFCPLLDRPTYRHISLQHSQYKGVDVWTEDLNQTVKLKIEEHWKHKLGCPKFISNKDEAKYYVLSMFPYPSGNLHMGHIRVYSISDALARFYRINGKNVLHPIGWDAFGLPAENAAIERGLSSEKWTADNIESMRQQLIQLGCTFDWSREVTTCHKDYYKFTQAIFLKMHEKGLVYQKNAMVNWDPVDKTVLANEQVDENGCSWRSGAKVEKKVLKQWFIQTTSFAKALYDGLNREDLEDWKDIIDLQKHWIGACDGVSFEFPLTGLEGELTLWTDKPEYLSRVKFITVPPGSVTDLESGGRGNRKLDVNVVNTLTGKPLPLFVSDELNYHEGADGRLGIPDLYECDEEFAHKVGLPLDNTEPIQDNISDRETIISKINGRITSSKIRDWLISRQRHWGTPIPMVHCNTCGTQPVHYDELPVELPAAKTVSEKGSTLEFPDHWTTTSCPKCGGPASRDRDTMDTFVDSSWYYLRYTDPHNQEEPFSKAAAAKLMPVDIYIGGKEHAVLHLYYARFVSHFLHSLGWLADPEPFKRLVVQGMVMGKSYRVQSSGKYIPASQVNFAGKRPVEIESGDAVTTIWEKMSKSKYNGVDPTDVFREHGVDTTRLLILGSVAPTSPRNWDESTFPGILNWQRKAWLTVQEFRKARSTKDVLQVPADLADVETFLRDSRNYHLRGISVSYRVTHQFNRVIAKLQSLTGDMRRYGPEYKAHSKEFERALGVMVVSLSPLAPHFAAELWAGLQGVTTVSDDFDWSKPVHHQSWPEIDKDYMLDINCLVNSSLKDTLKVSRIQFDQLTESSATQLALTSDQVRVYTNQAPVQKTNFKVIPGLYASIDILVDHTKLQLNKDHHKNTRQEWKKSKFKKRFKVY